MNFSSQLRTEQQLELETFAIDYGIKKYRETLQNEGAGDLPPGMKLIKAAMEPMVTALKQWLSEAGIGLASRNAGVFYFVNSIDPEAAAWITAQTCISRLHELPKVTTLAIAIALRLEQTINVDAIAKANPKLAKRIAKQLLNIKADKNRLVFIRKGIDSLEMADVKAIQWDDTVRTRVGTLLIEMFASSTGLVAAETTYLPGNKTPMVLRPTESCRMWLEESHARCELLTPLRLPMVCQPRHWTSPFNGGYLTPAIRQPLVKTHNRDYLTQLKEWDMPWVYASVNALQDTAWSINTGVYAVIKHFWESGRTIMVGDKDGDFLLPPRDEAPLPAKSWTEGAEPEPEVLQAWKVDAARTYEANAKMTSKRAQLSQKLWVAEKMMENGNSFHFVYSLDWRGRIYPVAASLSPQGDDSAKALMHFTRAVPLGADGAYWLAIHGANSYGVDKVSFEERIKWVQDHTDDILATANDPVNGTNWWMQADAPFTFLAFCLEWAKLQAHVDADQPTDTFESRIPVAFDGACNGLQNFSAMLRDPVGGKATGLVPGERPADIYAQVAKVTQGIIDRDAADGNEIALRWVGKMTRKLAKRPTMTTPYGVGLRGMRDQLYGELKDCDPKNRGLDAQYLAQCASQAISEVVVAARQAMDWLKEAAKVAASNQLPVRWKTPAGFLAVQDYREEFGDSLDFTVLGRRYQLIVNRTGDKLNTRKQALGISPNFVHSLDAAHLMRTVLFCAEDGMQDFAMIHDSYGCHAGHATLLRDNLRGAFVDQYSQPVLEQFRNELLEQLPPELAAELPPLPPMGTLDLEQVKQSEYFFA